MRYALYYAPPPGSLLHRLGAEWLGRDAFGHVPINWHGDERLWDMTSDPRRYGFHATLRPPFALKDGMSPAALGIAAGQMSASLRPAPIASLKLKQIDGFLALVPDGDSAAIDALAAICMREFEEFRRPPGEAELNRRRSAGLSPRQDEYLRRWGYPHVFDEFRFHMTLSRRLTASEAELIEPLARAHFFPVLGQPLEVDGLTLFCQAAPDAPFEAVQHFSFAPLSAEATT